MNTPLKTVLEHKGQHVHVTSPSQTVLDAIKTMHERHVGALLVLDDGKPVGTVGPDTTVQQAMAIVTEKRFRHLPVMDGDELLGVVSSGDLTHWVVKSQSHEIESLIRYITGQYPA